MSNESYVSIDGMMLTQSDATVYMAKREAEQSSFDARYGKPHERTAENVRAAVHAVRAQTPTSSSYSVPPLEVPRSPEQLANIGRFVENGVNFQVHHGGMRATFMPGLGDH